MQHGGEAGPADEVVPPHDDDGGRGDLTDSITNVERPRVLRLGRLDPAATTGLQHDELGTPGPEVGQIDGKRRAQFATEGVVVRRGERALKR
jgi:hypothetical protein